MRNSNHEVDVDGSMFRKREGITFAVLAMFRTLLAQPQIAHIIAAQNTPTDQNYSNCCDRQINQITQIEGEEVLLRLQSSGPP